MKKRSGFLTRRRGIRDTFLNKIHTLTNDYIKKQKGRGITPENTRALAIFTKRLEDLDFALDPRLTTGTRRGIL